RTGLLLDPYFSGTKLAWLLDNVPEARARAERGELAFGTVDCWLIFMLTGGRVHATDATNASRTLLYDIREGRWDGELLSLFNVPRALLPEVRPSCADYGRLAEDILGAPVPVLGVAGDQQAAMAGQACFRPGTLKSTYGTGCFALVNTGRSAALSGHRLLTTVAYDVGEGPVYALEGSIFMAGAIVQWMRDTLGIIETAAESADLAAAARGQEGVYMVPAFTGLGAPYWDPQARGAILGMTRDTGRADLVRAALDSVCYQTRDLMGAMDADMGAAGSPDVLRVDGGMAANDWFLQRLADVTGRAVERPVVIETTALGAAYLAGLKAGLFGSLDEIAGKWRRDRLFEPQLGADARESLYAGWKAAVARVLTEGNPDG
ncbi:MAG: FGGY family carbohydrate kinase, partial [Alphaproteobacteria bacterium]